MAAVVNRTWCRSATARRCLMRSYATASVKQDEGVFKRVKKFVFGETVEPLDQSESVYYELKEDKPPMVYSMNPNEVKEKLDSIVKELNGHSLDIIDDMVKYKILSRCHEEFGVLFPSYKLNKIHQIQDIEDYYCSFPSSSKPFNIIDTDNLPPNLKIGGKVPRK